MLGSADHRSEYEVKVPLALGGWGAHPEIAHQAAHATKRVSSGQPRPLRFHQRRHLPRGKTHTRQRWPVVVPGAKTKTHNKSSNRYVRLCLGSIRLVSCWLSFNSVRLAQIIAGYLVSL